MQVGTVGCGAEERRARVVDRGAVARSGAAAVLALVLVGTVGCAGDGLASAPAPSSAATSAPTTTTSTTAPSGPTPVGDVVPFTWALPGAPLAPLEGFVPNGTGIATVRFADGRVLEGDIVSCDGWERWYVTAEGTTPDGFAYRLSVHNDYALVPKGFASVDLVPVGDPARTDPTAGWGPRLSGTLPIAGDETGSLIGPGWLALSGRTVDGQLIEGTQRLEEQMRTWVKAKGPRGEGWTTATQQRLEAFLAAEVYPGLVADGLAVPVESIQLLVGACDDS